MVSFIAYVALCAIFCLNVVSLCYYLLVNELEIFTDLEIGVKIQLVRYQRNSSSVLTRATRRNIPEDASLHSHRRENLKSYKVREVPTSCKI
jgi:hypothetical protein